MEEIPQRRGRLTLPRSVRAAEERYLRRRRAVPPSERPAPDGEAPPPPLADVVGIALSGGGIRSSTLCLGVLQAFGERGLWRDVDYLSTVSGGGYVGGCASSLATILEDDPPAAARWKAAPGDGPDEKMPLQKREQLHHLRTHGDFLIVRKGLFQVALLRTLGSYATGLFCSLLFTISTLAVLVGLLLLLGGMLTGDALGAAVEEGGWGAWNLGDTSTQLGYWALLAAVLGVAFACVSLCRRPCPGSSPGGVSSPLLERWPKLFALEGVVLPFVVLVGLAGVQNHLQPDEALGLPGLFLPAVLFGGGWLTVGVARARLAREDQGGRDWDKGCRTRLGTAQGTSTLALLLALGCVLLAYVVSGHAALLRGALPYVSVIALVALRLLVRGSASGEAGAASSVTLRRVLARSALWVVLAIVLLVLIVALAAGALALAGSVHAALAVLLGGGALVVVLLVRGVDFNRVSPHYFYRDRISDAYLVTKEAGPGRDRVLRDDSAVRVQDLHERWVEDAPTKERRSEASPAPYHLILCAANLPGSRDLARKDRRSDHFVFSREYSGSSVTGYVPTAEYAGGHVTLAKAMTISGAAAASNMGFHTTLARAIALTMLNVRLGYWLVNPRRYPGRLFPDAVDADQVPPVTGRAREDGFPRFVPTWWLLCLLREMTCTANAEQEFVNLSDGGHTGDNVGLYPLLQRRCRLIIACDAECDPDYDFTSLASAIRQIDTDENVKIDIQPDGIRPRKEGRGLERHYALGRIEYPDCTQTSPGREDARPAIGWLLYLKSSFFDRSEPAPVKSYARTNPAFPHQPTSDQFFDDDQFEAYRSLGQHIGEAVCDAIHPGVPDGSEVTADDVIRWCARTWADARTRG